MKKLFITAVLASAVCFANAQDMMSKKGTPILPEADDWSIGFDASPLLDYFGNLFNNTVNNSVNASYKENLTIVGKMMKDANTAYRAKIALNFGSSSTTAGSFNDSLYDPSKTTTSSNKITLGAGLQKFRGKGRLKGFYGAEASIGLGGGKNTYEYVKNFDALNQGTQGSRDMEVKNGSTFSFGVRGFIGAEYFFAPKISIGAEYGWGIGISSTGAAESTSQEWDPTTPPGTVKTTVSKGGKSSSFNVGVDNMGGQIDLNLYF